MTHDPPFPTWVRLALPVVACLSTLYLPCPSYSAATTVMQVSAGDGHSMFVKSDGSLWGMGDNTAGQLGLGFSLAQTNLPQQILSSNVTAVAAGSYHTLFLESNGSLGAMGYNANGQLGDGSTTSHFFPETIVSGAVTGIAAGTVHSLFTTSTFERPFETIAFWGMGENSSGQLGDGTMTSHSSPEQIQSTDLLLDEVRSVAGGGAQSLFIREDGSLWATGDNGAGQLGDGTTTERDSYEEIVSSDVAAVAAGDFHSLFIKSDGSLWAMGDNASGELGDNSLVSRDSPEQVGINVAAIAAGLDFSLFIKTDGSLWAMGANDYGQLGDGTTIQRILPVMIVSSNVVAIAAGVFHSLFVKSDGSLWAMGYNALGQLGDGTYTDRHFPVQVVPLVIPQPAITNISLAGKNLVLQAANGESGRICYTLMSANLAQPLNLWTPLATNLLTTDGAFAITATNAVAPTVPQRFFVLQVQ